MAFSRALDKVTIDRDWIERFRSVLSRPGNKLREVREVEIKDVDEVVDEITYELAKGESFDLDAYLAEEASRLHQDLSVDFNKKESALIIYRRASERVREKLVRVRELKSSNSSDYEQDFSEAQREISSIKNHLRLTEMIWSRYNLEDFRGYDLAHLSLIFDDLNDLGYIDDKNSERAAKKIIQKDANRLEEMHQDNEEAKQEIGMIEDNLGRFY